MSDTPSIRCSCCGRCVAGFDVEATVFLAKLSHLQALIFRAVIGGGGQFVPWYVIALHAWSTDPHGGPDDAANVISAMVHRMRRKLQPLGVAIEGHKGGAGGYRFALLRKPDRASAVVGRPARCEPAGDSARAQ